MLQSPGKAEALGTVDEFGLLAAAAHVEPKEINTIDDVLNDDALDLQSHGGRFVRLNVYGITA